jgi:hypothetical protein
LFNYTSKLEVNVRQGPTAASDFVNLPTFLIKNRIPVLIIDPAFIEAAIVDRSRCNGNYQIITTVDFDTLGKSYALEKITHLPRVAFNIDGLEILLTANRNDKESLNELKAISEFVRGSVSQLMEIRWVFGFRIRKHSELANFMPHLKNYPANFLRLDTNCEVPKLDIQKHLDDIAYVQEHCNIPIKVSGNIDLKTMEALPKIPRFDVTVSQAKKIIAELKEKDNPQPKENNQPVPAKEEKKIILTSKPQTVNLKPEPRKYKVQHDSRLTNLRRGKIIIR